MAAQFVFSPACARIQGELVVADAPAGCMGSGECVHLNIKGLRDALLYLPLVDYGLRDALLYLLIVGCQVMFKNS